MARSLCIILPEFLQSFQLRTAPASEFFVQPAEASLIQDSGACHREHSGACHRENSVNFCSTQWCLSS